MPVIPTFTAQERAVAARINPASAGAPWATLGDAILKATGPIAAFNEEYQRAKKITEASDRMTGATKALYELEDKWSKVADRDKAGAGYTAEADALRTQILEGINDPMVRAQVQASFDDQAVTRLVSTQRNAFGLEASGRVKNLNNNLNDLAQQAAQASSPALREQLVKQGQDLIAATEAGNWISPEESGKQSLSFANNVSVLAARQDMDRNPWAALKSLQDPNLYAGLQPDDRQTLIDQTQAEIRRRNAEARQQASEAKQLLVVQQSQLYDDFLAIAQTTGKSSNLVSLESLTAAFDEKGPMLWERLQDAQKTGIAQTELALATPERREEIKADAKPEAMKTEPRFVATAEKPDGMSEEGNIDLSKRPAVPTGEGTATVRSISINEDGTEILIPTVSPDGKLLTNQEATALYHETGQHLGKFATAEQATAYAEQLHQQQAEALGVGAAEDQKNFEILVNTDAALAKEREDDPAQYARTYSTAVRLALVEAASDPSKTEAAIDLSLKTQKDAGVAVPNLRVLPKAAAKALIADIETATGKAAVGKIKDLEKTYGKYWDQVYGELVQNGLPAGYSVLATTDDQAAAVVLANQLEQPEQARAALGSEGAKAVDEAVAEQIKFFASSMMYAPDGARVVQEYRTAANLLAYNYALRADPADAAAAAVWNLVNNKYEYSMDDPAIHGAGFNARVLKESRVDAETVETYGDFLVGILTPDQLADPGEAPELTPEGRKELYIENVRAGTWVTNEADDGWRLLDNAGNPVRLSNGRFLEFKYTNIPPMEPTDPTYGHKAVPVGYRQKGHGKYEAKDSVLQPIYELLGVE